MKLKKTIIFTDPQKKFLSFLPKNLNNIEILCAGAWCEEKSYFLKNKNLKFFQIHLRIKNKKKNHFIY